MLAYELYLKNKGYRAEFVSVTRPVKKVIMRGKRPVMDNKSLEQYGEQLEEYKWFHEMLSMPANTDPYLGLKFRVNSPRLPDPYVELEDEFVHKNSAQTISLKIGRDPVLFIAELNLNTMEEKIAAQY